MRMSPLVFWSAFLILAITLAVLLIKRSDWAAFGIIAIPILVGIQAFAILRQSDAPQDDKGFEDWYER